MARIPIYTNSLGASILSILGYGLAFFGIINIFGESVVGGIIILLIGFGVAFSAERVSEKKQFRVWKSKLEEAGLTSLIKNDMDMAIAVYNSNPSKQTLAYISELNPTAGKHIEELIRIQNGQE